MNKLMGHNMMRKDGEAHLAERKVIFPSVSPKTVAGHWRAQFQAHADRVLDELQGAGRAELCESFSLPFSAECLKSITGLTNMRYQDMDAWSQAMIDGIANYSGDPEIEARCHRATAGIDAAIDDMLPVRKEVAQSEPAQRHGRSRHALGQRARQRQARHQRRTERAAHAILGTIWALLTHPDQLAKVRAGEIGWLQAFEEYARWISPIGMSPRRIARQFSYNGVGLEPDERIFFMFGAANRDEAHFPHADRFDASRDTSKSIAFGAGPHFCAGAWASRTMVAEVALPSAFARLGGLTLDDLRAGPHHRLGLPRPAEPASGLGIGAEKTNSTQHRLGACFQPPLLRPVAPVAGSCRRWRLLPRALGTRLEA